MASYRMRVQVRDTPGALAELTRRLAAAEVDVLRVDVHGVDARVAIDELSVIAPDSVREGALRRIVDAAGATALVVAPLAVESDTDPVTRALSMARDLRDAASLDVADAALADLLSVPAAWVLPAPVAGEPLMGGEVLPDVPTVLTVETAGGRDRDAVATVALLPTRGILGVALHWGRWEFTASELARATALLELVAAGGAPATSPALPLARLVPLPDAGDLCVRTLGPADAAHLLDLDLHLTDRTRRLRYLATRGLPRGTELRAAAAAPSDDGVAVGAWGSDGMVGAAQLVRLAEEPTTADFAVVVRDVDQRRGVGRELLRMLADEARERGIDRLVGHVSASNDAIRRLVRRELPMSILRLAHGQAEIVADLRTPASFP